MTTTFTIPDWKGGDPGAAVCEIGGAGVGFVVGAAVSIPAAPSQRTYANSKSLSGGKCRTAIGLPATWFPDQILLPGLEPDEAGDPPQIG